MFMFQTLKLVPGGSVAGIEYEVIPIVLFGLGGLLLLLVPFLDRDASRTGRSPLWTAGGAVAATYIVVMTSLGYHSFVPVLIVLGTVVLIAIFGWATGSPRGSR
ncbi:MAG TPA: hypothetical protein VFP10_11685, partial [Candidatus Eisenbacteria bacterium]|nr:hypothetical protein [Candidatus Eisenbacteria bacterium]